MIKRYNDFELHLTTDGQQLIIDINGRPTAINLPQPIKIALETYFSRREMFIQQFTQDMTQVGYALYDFVFLQEVREQFKAYLNRRKQNEGVRVCVNIQEGALSDAIWEILCDKLSPAPNFLALDPRTPVVRIPRIGQEVYLREMYFPLRLLVVLASPRRIEAIDSLAEKTTLEQALRQARNKKCIAVHYLGFDDPKEASFDKLQEHLVTQEKPYDIVHIIGHGLLESGEEGITAFVEQGQGTREDVRASSLANLFRSRGVMLVILQSCQSGAVDPFALRFSSTAQQLVAAGVPAVLAMQEKVDQDVARHFMEILYTQWLIGSPFEDALTQARHSVYQRFPERESPWAIPVFYICPGVYLRPSKPARKVDSIERQLDAALPRSIKMGGETELLTLIRTPTSPGLQEMLNVKPRIYDAKAKDVLTSSSFDILFPIDETSGKLLPKDIQIVVESNDFHLSNSKQKVQVRPQGDDVFYVFRVIPKHKGRAKLFVSVVDTTEEPITLTQLRLMATIRDGKAFKSQYQVMSSDQSSNAKVKGEKRIRGKNASKIVKIKPQNHQAMRKKDRAEKRKKLPLLDRTIEDQTTIEPEYLYESKRGSLDEINAPESIVPSLDNSSYLSFQLEIVRSHLQVLSKLLDEFLESPLEMFPSKTDLWQLNLQSAIEELRGLLHDIRIISAYERLPYINILEDIHKKMRRISNIFDKTKKVHASNISTISSRRKLFELYKLLGNCETILDEIISRTSENDGTSEDE